MMTKAACAAFMAFSLVACGGDKKDESGEQTRAEKAASEIAETKAALLELVPKNVDVVACVNPESFLLSAGCEVEGSKVTLSPEIYALCKDNKHKMVLNIAVQQLEGLNLKSALCFNGKVATAVMIWIEDKAKVSENLFAIADDDPEEISGFTCYKVQGQLVATKDNVLYWFDKFSDMERLGALYEAETFESFGASYPEVVKVLDAESDFALVANSGLFDAATIFESDWFVATATLNGSSISGDIFGITNEGEFEDFGQYVPEISSDIYALMPSGGNDRGVFVCAMGNIMETKMVKDFVNGALGSQLGSWQNLLTDLNGSVAMGATCPLDYSYDELENLLSSESGSVAFAEQCGFALVGNYGENAGTVVEQIVGEAGKSNFIPTAAGYRTTVENITINIESRGDYVIVDNLTDADSGLEMPSSLAGSRVAYYINMPKSKFTQSLGADCGFRLSASLEGKAMKGSLTFTDTSDKFLVALLKICANNQ